MAKNYYKGAKKCKNCGNSQEINNLGGERLLANKYNSSLFNFVSAMYPDQEWLPWQFASLPIDFWSNVNNQIKFINWAEKELKIKEKNDWFNVTTEVTNPLQNH